MVIGLFKKGESGSKRGKGGRTSAAMGLPLRDAPYVILDTELTGLDRKRDSIVSVGALKMAGGRIEMGHTFYQLVNPASEMKKETVIIHEITPSEVSKKPAIDQVISELLQFCGEGVLVGHCISLDLHFINREMRRILGLTLDNPAIDTMTLADWLRWNTANMGSDAFNPKNYQLHEIAKTLGIPVQGAHNALMDAFMTAQVLQRMLPRLMKRGIDTLGRLLEIGNPSRKLIQPEAVIW